MAGISRNRFAIYLRCSTQDQAEGDYTTIDVQRQINTDYVKANGALLIEEYCDPARSGYDSERPAFDRLLADAEKKKFDAVVITKSDRLGRGDAGSWARESLKRCRIGLITTEEAYTDDRSGRMTQHVDRFLSSVYREQISDWTVTKMAQMTRDGYYCGGSVPFGYTSVRAMEKTGDKEPPHKLVIDPAGAEILRAAYSIFLSSGKIADVTRYLKLTTNRRWVSGTVRNTLSNERNIGILRFRDVVNESAIEPIIEPGVWQKAQDLLSTINGTHARSPRSDSYHFYLRGRVWCPHCNGAYTQGFAKGGEVHYYLCNKHNHRDTKCPVARINSDALHSAVIEQIARAAEHWTVMRKLIADSEGWQTAPADLQSRRGLLAKQLQFIGAKEVNLTNSLAAGRASQAIFSALEKLEVDKSNIQSELSVVTSEIQAQTIRRPTPKMVQESWQNVLAVMEVASEEDKTELLQCLVESVTIHEKGSVSFKTLALPSLEFALSRDLGAGALTASNYNLSLLLTYLVRRWSLNRNGRRLQVSSR